MSYPANTELRGISIEDILKYYRSMVRIRTSENKIADLVRDEKLDENGDLVYGDDFRVVRMKKEVICPAHLYSGEEAVAVGVCAHLNDKDTVFGAHRSHGHYLAKGGNLNELFAEIFGKTTGCAKGRGGSMHLVDPEIGFLGSTPIVASSIPHAIGAGIKSWSNGEATVAVSFFGDGATEEGRFHEAMNIASYMKLPVVFVCENNLYSSHVRIEQRRAQDTIYKHGEPFGMPCKALDGNNIFEVYEAAGEAIERARTGGGPTLLEMKTYRIHGHVGANLDLEKGLRNRMEFDYWRDKDPIQSLRHILVGSGIVDATILDKIDNEALSEVENATKLAREASLPDREELLDYTLAGTSLPIPDAKPLPRTVTVPQKCGGSEEVPLESNVIGIGDAIREATEQLMDIDERVIILGQGVNSPWYVGNTAKGLFKKFGPKRVIDTPISEDCVTGATMGLALAGMRPIVIHPRVDFALLGTEQLIGQAANWHYMTAGKVKVPMVARLIVNRGGEQAAQHSQSLQAMFAHVPGLIVVMPCNAYDAKGLLVSAVLSDDPVIFLEDRWTYDEKKEVPKELYTIPIGKGQYLRKGTDLTIIATSYMSLRAQEIADSLKEEGISIDVVDLRTIKPIDRDIILESVAKTGKVVVADGGWDSYGVTAEVSAIIAESDVVTKLKAPIVRFGLPECPAPMSKPLEDRYFDYDNSQFTAKVRDLLNR